MNPNPTPAFMAVHPPLVLAAFVTFSTIAVTAFWYWLIRHDPTSFLAAIAFGTLAMVYAALLYFIIY